MSLVSSVKDIGHIVGWRCIDDSRRNDIGHVTMVSVFGCSQGWVRIELTNGGKMDVAAASFVSTQTYFRPQDYSPKNSNSNGLLGS